MVLILKSCPRPGLQNLCVLLEHICHLLTQDLIMILSLPVSSSTHGIPSHSSAHNADDCDIEDYQIIKMMYAETCAVIASLDYRLPDHVELALARCESCQARLEALLSRLRYGGKPTHSLSLQVRMQRYLTRSEKGKLQTSFRDAVMLLRDTVSRRVINPVFEEAPAEQT